MRIIATEPRAAHMFNWLKSDAPVPRRGMPSPRLDEQEFKRRFRTQFQDPNFDSLSAELDKVADAAWDAYDDSRKAPITRKAGTDYAAGHHIVPHRQGNDPQR